ncbi:uncharacterized protein LOC111054605 isoform X1 [Nilaparvata lugens]|uniref:uncharacterized protein LOC111054605 isoform X1 n=1 Tax=Nilaparvata lugens TaxID=108931 RepID=UPI00193DF2BC|nr:uncharacterized protein LOC111054605 isoform X1 [Nilaparvata lugens]
MKKIQDPPSSPLTQWPPSRYPFYQAGIRRHPKLFLDTLPQTNLPNYMARGMQLDSNVYKIVTMTPNGFKDYATLISRKYLDIDEKVKKEKGRKNGQ